MKLVKILSIAFVVGIQLVNANTTNKQFTTHIRFSETPAKTIIIKHPAANNIDGFFSTTTVMMFEIYKPGSKEDLAKIIDALKKNNNVESCMEGPLTGDYQAITLTIKTMKDKKWYAELFKKAGLKTIKINNNPVIEVGNL